MHDLIYMWNHKNKEKQTILTDEQDKKGKAMSKNKM